METRRNTLRQKPNGLPLHHHARRNRYVLVMSPEPGPRPSDSPKDIYETKAEKKDGSKKKGTTNLCALHCIGRALLHKQLVVGIYFATLA